MAEVLKVLHEKAYVCKPVNGFSEFQQLWRQYQGKPWGLIVPTEMPYIEQLLTYHLNNNSKILLVDDIDFDGVSAASVSLEYLKPLFRDRVDVYTTTAHGINDEIKALSQSYDLLVVVDGGTNQEDELCLLDCDVLILDHHTPEEGARHIIWQCECGERVKTLIHCNSKYTEALAAISAGMLCYIVFHYFYHDIRGGRVESANASRTKRSLPDIDYYEIGAISLISDMVPIDEYVLLSLMHYFDRYAGSTEFVRLLLVKYDSTVTVRGLQWEAFPLINYTKRLQDSDSMALLYRYGVEAAIGFLEKNRKTGRSVVDAIELYGERRKYKMFIYVDATLLFNIYNTEISNFKGLMCNRLSNSASVPVIVGIDKEYDGVQYTEVSVRSQGYDSCTFFQSKDYTDGGGHPPACGFKFPTEKLSSLLQEYDAYLEMVSVEDKGLVEVNNVDEVNLPELALYNHLMGTGLKQLSVLVSDFDKSQLQMSTQNVGFYKGIPVEIVTPLQSKSVLIKPIITNYLSRQYKLELHNSVEED